MAEVEVLATARLDVAFRDVGVTFTADVLLQGCVVLLPHSLERVPLEAHRIQKRHALSRQLPFFEIAPLELNPAAEVEVLTTARLDVVSRDVGVTFTADVLLQSRVPVQPVVCGLFNKHGAESVAELDADRFGGVDLDFVRQLRTTRLLSAKA